MEHTGTDGILPNHIFGSYLNQIPSRLGSRWWPVTTKCIAMYQPYFKLFRQAWLFKIENNRWLDCETRQQQKFRCKKHISIIIKTAVREILLFFYHRVKIRGGDFKQWNASTMYQHCAQWGQNFYNCCCEKIHISHQIVFFNISAVFLQRQKRIVNYYVKKFVKDSQ